MALEDLEGEAAWSQERSACGVGFVASRKARADNAHLHMALRALTCVEHRGACGADLRSSDGAGIMTDIPFELLGREKGSVALAVLLVPPAAEAQRKALAVFQETFGFFGLDVAGFRDVPVNVDVLGAEARRTMPAIMHAIVKRPDHCRTDMSFNKLLYAAKQLTRTKAIDVGLPEFFFASLSSNTIVYKALTRAQDLGRFYLDLQDPRYATRFALFHRRFSTNTRTSWDKAQPFRLIAHNGEINTIAGNRSWGFSREKSLGLRANELLTHHGISDTGSLNEMVEALLYRSSIPRVEDVMAILVPPAGMPHNFYRFWSRAMEPWDGPAFITYSDGLSVGARLDRNGFRPCRWARTPDHFFLASEAGAFVLDESVIEAKGRLAAGSGVKVNLETGAIDFTDPGASEENHDAAYDARLIPLHTLPVHPTPPAVATQRLFGWTQEDVERLLVPMTATGKEPIGSMGDTARPAILSAEVRSFFDYFHQDFAQVTNPPVDYLRETTVTDLGTTLGRKPNPFSPKELIPPPVALQLDSPIISLGGMAHLASFGAPGSPDKRVTVLTLDATFPAHHGVVGFRFRLDEIRKQAVTAVRDGAQILVLSDALATQQRPPMPSLLVLRAVVNELNESGNRLDASVVVHSGEVTNAHHVAALVAFGASAVCPYLALEWARLGEHEALQSLTQDAREQHLVAALDVGLLKVMSKMGISVVRSYHSARLFSAVGIGPGLVREFFPGLYSPLGGLELPDVVDAVLKNAQHAQPSANALVHTHQFKEHVRGKQGEHHSMTNARSKIIHTLVREHALNLDNLELYDAYLRHAQGDAPVNLRHLLEVTSVGPVLAEADVERAEAILARFGSGAMSFGAISAESQRDIILAMQRIGGRSNSGEGGENPYYATHGIAASTKQVASARFGVTAEYLTAANELQIKIAQGAKPGEGGQLMGVKVTEDIARARHALPGIDLISPPPLHDLYSIEDLKQLVYELRQVHPTARVSVKLVAGAGIGAIAVGVAKAGADVIHISGADGGTGAAGLLSMKHAGLPWELGLTEAHRALVANGLRRHVTLRVDGGLATGKDVVLATLLGAEEYDFGKILLVAEGCVMARVCEKNTCPTGIATHDPRFKAKYKGTPEHVETLLRYIAQDVRRVLAGMGAKDLLDLVGRSDLLRVRQDCDALVRARHLDLSLLVGPPAAERCTQHNLFASDTSAFNARALQDLQPVLRASEDVEVHYDITTVDRAAFATVAGALAQHRRTATRPHGVMRAVVKGSAGQGFAAFTTNGMAIQLFGEANDGVAKSMGGGVVVVRPPEEARYAAEDNAIIGNQALYGATGGTLLVNGQAGDRFAVRNSGAGAVVEGVGLHCCEYMTRGLVVVLGPLGGNAGAGMTGGTLVIPADQVTQVNPQYVAAVPLHGSDATAVLDLLTQHERLTGSRQARVVLASWKRDQGGLVAIVPRGVLARGARPTENVEQSNSVVV